MCNVYFIFRDLRRFSLSYLWRLQFYVLANLHLYTYSLIHLMARGFGLDWIYLFNSIHFILFKWPQGAERQYANSTLAISWTNEVQKLSFASMASRQVAVKHGFVSKIAEGCSSYDVIAPWHDLTWTIFFLPNVAQGLPHKVGSPKPRGAIRAAVFRYLRKTSGGCTNPPVRVRVKWK